jgi:hypothetical protein
MCCPKQRQQHCQQKEGPHAATDQLAAWLRSELPEVGCDHFSWLLLIAVTWAEFVCLSTSCMGHSITIVNMIPIALRVLGETSNLPRRT